MKGFAKFVLGLSILGSVVGFIALVSGGAEGAAFGAPLLGCSFLSILLCCVVMALVDIRDSLVDKSKADVSKPIESQMGLEDLMQRKREREAAAALARPVLSTEQVHAALNKL